jgi:hypothetical protein
MSRNRPRLVARIGLTGLDSENLGPSAANEDIFNAIMDVVGIATNTINDFKDNYSHQNSKICIVLSIMEMTELWVAREILARERELELHCILSEGPAGQKEDPLTPSKVREALADFPSSKMKMVELDNSLDAREAASQAVLRQCDILIALRKNENRERGEPGTVVAEALSRNIPVILINLRSNYEICLWERGGHAGGQSGQVNIARLPDRLKSVFALPATANAKALKQFFEEDPPKPMEVYDDFRELIAYNWEEHLDAMGKEEGATGGRWAKLEEHNKQIEKELLHGCQHHLTEADELAKTYGSIYRSLFIITYGLGAGAVLSAFFGIYIKNLHWMFLVELVLILAVLASVWRGNRRLHAHERWIDYRLLAEGFRQMLFLLPLARVTPAFEIPAHLSQDDPSSTWFNWYFRAVVRELGMISAKMDQTFLETYRQVLADAVRAQVKYHKENAVRMELAHHRLHSFVVQRLFPATLVACFLHLLPLNKCLCGPLYRAVELVLSLSAVVLPAVGAAIEGISHQGEFERLGRRSKALGLRLKSFLADLENSDGPMSSKELGAQAEYFCQIQLLEQTDWRAAFISKPLAPP